MLEVTNDNCHFLTGYTYKQIFQLAGVECIHSFEEIIEGKDMEIYVSYDPETKHVEVEVITPIIKELRVDIFLDSKIIKNAVFIKATECTLTGLGFLRLYNQVMAARSNDFKKIKLHAFGSKNDPEYYGYNIWGKFGFYMTDKKHIEFFLELMQANGLTYKTIYEAQCNEDGLKVWKEYGRKWYGCFDLEDDSDSMKALQEQFKKGRIIHL